MHAIVIGTTLGLLAFACIRLTTETDERLRREASEAFEPRGFEVIMRPDEKE